MTEQTQRRIVEIATILSTTDLEDENVEQTARILADVAEGLDNVSPLQVQQVLIQSR